MKKDVIGNYISELLNTFEVEKENSEIPNAILLLVVYMIGLQRKPFPLDMVGKEDAIDIEKELPVQFHTIVAKLAIKKSKIEQRVNDVRIIEYITRKLNTSLENFRNYFTSLVS